MCIDAAPNWAEVVSSFASLGTGIVVLLGAFQVRRMNQQMHREFEMQYLIRFWTLMDRRSRRLQLRGRPTQRDESTLIAYLDLSEDQIALREKGRVTNHTWSFWARDIRAMCLSGAIHLTLRKFSQSQYPHIRRLIAQADYDPLTWGRLRKWWSGL